VVRFSGTWRFLIRVCAALVLVRVFAARSLVVLPALILVWACSAPGFGQSETTGTPSFRADTTLVLVPVTVTDSSNRYVLGLEKENFQIFEDGAEQKITHFSAEDAPLSVGVLVDTSGSMGGKLETSRRAVGQFLKTMTSADEAFLIEFNDQATLLQPFTTDTGQIEKKLGAASSRGLTAMFDAIHMALQQMKSAKNPRKAILIVSDGGDNNSQVTSAQIQALVREADVQIYAMGVFEPTISFGLTAAEKGGPRLLSDIADQTGGRALAASNPSELPGVAGRIGIELRNQYVLAYSPSNEERDGKFRKLEIKIIQPAGLSALKARWRLGYYAPLN
jgi:Ca-activated chloride channel family protein